MAHATQRATEGSAKDTLVRRDLEAAIHDLQDELRRANHDVVVARSQAGSIRDEMARLQALLHRIVQPRPCKGDVVDVLGPLRSAVDNGASDNDGYSDDFGEEAHHGLRRGTVIDVHPSGNSVTVQYVEGPTESGIDVSLIQWREVDIATHQDGDSQDCEPQMSPRFHALRIASELQVQFPYAASRSLALQSDLPWPCVLPGDNRKLAPAQWHWREMCTWSVLPVNTPSASCTRRCSRYGSSKSAPKRRRSVRPTPRLILQPGTRQGAARVGRLAGARESTTRALRKPAHRMRRALHTQMGQRPLVTTLATFLAGPRLGTRPGVSRRRACNNWSRSSKRRCVLVAARAKQQVS